ncbi:glutamine--fructose-6-phosphate transaminase (isomerizing) [Candidatus Beckwithbacteria bacterium CG10_big_fil_rev_8_21_14_0_10_34_10]|uniref:Glutamine--fructose-6-phosphate aminotransferase [isomerizing] n=1 Tax=Candidatus Beckwithbacteria bacterium CG10_big_fil_rev_8_21_14_0_10_34_10 TaxID=1974495 RepID=A0A2H0WB54_9BACT|nr:MAG: glutamine--fructose-6-phosphate transaminase (isomerizing) [Candidatus Beckwithbacteria bacterium CG10_big_fil_rev_8_21_14_0_10_34_10]
MCGIVAYIGKSKNGSQFVFQGLKKLEYRGYDSWGLAVKPLRSQVLKVEKHIGKIGQAKTKLPLSSIAIGHTRWATHGGVTNSNAHPHLDCSRKLAVIHNGIVENYQEIKTELKKKGHQFRSETDTEVIAHFIEEKLKTMSLRKAVFSTFKALSGSNAICVLDSKKETILACRDGSPLVVGIGKDEYFLASDVTPFLKKTKKAVFLKDREGVVLKRHGVSFFNLQTGKKKRIKVKIVNWEVEDAQKGGYSHFLIKEIFEQPKTISKTAELNREVIKKLSLKIKKGKKVILLGCGTASYCAKAAEYFFAHAGIEAQSYGAYEFLPFARFCNSKTIVIAISQSGETADTLIAVKKAKQKKALIAAIVNAPGSTLERLADFTLPVGAGPEIAVVSTKAFTSQLATLYLLSSSVKGKGDLGRKKIKSLDKSLRLWFKNGIKEKIIKLAKMLLDANDIYLIGKHLNYPAALEFALKIKETSYLHSEAFASGELKHGVISLIQKGTPCIALLDSQKKIKEEVLSSAMELKSRGAKIIGVAPFNSLVFDYHFKTPDLKELTLIPNIIVGQLLGYYLGLGRGTDPDKPRNLAKSVTVK